VGSYLGLQPGRRNSGQSEPQMHISKEGDPYLRTLLVQGAQHILGPFGVDCDLRRWGLKLAERGGRNAKKRAIVATARKLAVLLHHLWVSGEVYGPLHNSGRVAVTAAPAQPRTPNMHRAKPIAPREFTKSKIRITSSRLKRTPQERRLSIAPTLVQLSQPPGTSISIKINFADRLPSR